MPAEAAGWLTNICLIAFQAQKKTRIKIWEYQQITFRAELREAMQVLSVLFLWIFVCVLLSPTKAAFNCCLNAKCHSQCLWPCRRPKHTCLADTILSLPTRAVYILDFMYRTCYSVPGFPDYFAGVACFANSHKPPNRTTYELHFCHPTIGRTLNFKPNQSAKGMKWKEKSLCSKLSSGFGPLWCHKEH